MILPDKHHRMLLEIKLALDRAVETDDIGELIRNLAFAATKSQLLWDRIVGNESEDNEYSSLSLL
ncbi:hypothetical protein [Desulfomonile tiedjei]|uniref:Uncharacterized protein n=1 Tax=Desulfomonile tiedjei (strain ATCC 49306 / DSM 6799 / DCB-1) TaxID=706587 RepID=I4C506_DESTA|nr:hypothetical protein [Desulfomonile tiedjei]AFM24647.1 hypothetical protein Desti_1940 [Desulfomonile tiedjei DSM 6799]